MKYSFVIASYRRPTLLRQTVESLHPLLSEDGEILVVEQAPAVDLSAQFKPYARLQHLVLPRPSTVRARNYGILKARGAVVIFVDDDVVPMPGLIEGHLVAYQDHSVGAVAGRVLEKGKEPNLQVDPRAFDPEDGWRYTSFDHETRMDVMHAPTCNLSFRRSALIRVGGFDPAYRLAWREDSDLCFRVREAGYRIVFEPSASLVHLAASEGGTRPPPGARGMVRRELLMYRKHFVHYRDNLYFLLSHFRGPKRRKWLWDAYRTYVGFSRWPWRLLAKNSCFAAALVDAWLLMHGSRPPFFKELVATDESIA